MRNIAFPAIPEVGIPPQKPRTWRLRTIFRYLKRAKLSLDIEAGLGSGFCVLKSSYRDCDAKRLISHFQSKPPTTATAMKMANWIGHFAFTARALGLSIFTEAETLDELSKNVREALECFCSEEEAPATLVRFA